MSTPTPSTTATAAAKTAAAEKAEREKAAAVTGAEAVRDAVVKVAEAAVASAKATTAADAGGDFAVSGSPGGRFTIRGDGFTASGTVLLNGKQLDTTEWGDELIVGKLPSDAKSGEIVVWIDDKTQRRGYLKV